MGIMVSVCFHLRNYQTGFQSSYPSKWLLPPVYEGSGFSMSLLALGIVLFFIKNLRSP
jgi:hypothetical protein